jgi:hypothetical protein
MDETASGAAQNQGHGLSLVGAAFLGVGAMVGAGIFALQAPPAPTVEG